MARKTLTSGKAKGGRSELIEEAMKRFLEASDAEASIRVEQIVDIEFWAGEQWPPDVVTARKNDGRPCLTINKIADLVDKVVNEQAQAETGINVVAEGGDASEDTAQVLEGLIRNIEHQSGAQEVYLDAYRMAVVCGQGYWRVCTEYADDKSFDQVIRIRPLSNRFSVYIDPHHRKKDGSDAQWAFVIEDISHDEYKARYPKAEMASLLKFASDGSSINGWITKNTVRIAEYWRIETVRKTIEAEDGGEIRSRTVLIPTVKCDVINAVESLESYDWPGKTIPIVKTEIHNVEIDGKKLVWGLVRNARDAQRQYNYQRSAETEAIALAPKAPFIIASGQVEGFEGKWQSANVRNWPYLEYNPVTAAGQPAPPPQRNSVEPPVQAIAMATQQADADIRAVSGFYEPALGMQGPEQSAKAIIARQGQNALSTLTYSRALSDAKRRTGEILLEIIPKIYDAPRVERIIHPDGESSHVGLFNSQSTGISQEAVQNQLADMAAIRSIYDLGSGRYSVSVDVGRSYQSRRQEAAQGIMTLINSYPQIIPIAGDILARNLDWPGNKELAQRLKKMLPPQLQDPSDPGTALVSAQQQLAQSGAMIQELQQQLNAANAALQSQAVQMQGRKEIAAMQGQVQLVVEELKARSQAAQAQEERLLKLFEAIHTSAHEAALAGAQQIQSPAPQPSPPTA
jgi:hypothetical protein